MSYFKTVHLLIGISPVGPRFKKLFGITLCVVSLLTLYNMGIIVHDSTINISKSNVVHNVVADINLSYVWRSTHSYPTILQRNTNGNFVYPSNNTLINYTNYTSNIPTIYSTNVNNTIINFTNVVSNSTVNDSHVSNDTTTTTRFKTQINSTQIWNLTASNSTHVSDNTAINSTRLLSKKPINSSHILNSTKVNFTQESNTTFNFAHVLNHTHISSTNISSNNNTNTTRYTWTHTEWLKDPPECIPSFTINPSSLCPQNSRLDYVILVKSAPDNLAKRVQVREKLWPANLSGKRQQRAVFLLGRTLDPDVTSQIQKEANEYGDIVQADFIDAYRNLSAKVRTHFHFL